MSAVIDEIATRHRLTVTDYDRMGVVGILGREDRVELIDGAIIDMTPIGSRHASVVARLCQMLGPVAGHRAILWTQNPVVMGEYSEPQPDIAVLEAREDFYAAQHPRAADVLLVVEISDTSLRYDREVKLPLYARHGVPEVWLVDIEARALNRFWSPVAGGYLEQEAVSNLGAVTLKMRPALQLDLGGLFHKL
jgi:Uma2 family endonuclease